MTKQPIRDVPKTRLFHVVVEYPTNHPGLSYEGEGPSWNPDGLNTLERVLKECFGEIGYMVPVKNGIRRLEWIEQAGFTGRSMEEVVAMIRLILPSTYKATITIRPDPDSDPTKPIHSAC